jgi:hypothetical protein
MARKAREPPESVHSSERKIINELRVAEPQREKHNIREQRHVLYYSGAELLLPARTAAETK